MIRVENLNMPLRAGGHVVSILKQSAEFEIIGIASFPFDQGFMEWRALGRLVGSTLP